MNDSSCKRVLSVCCGLTFPPVCPCVFQKMYWDVRIFVVNCRVMCCVFYGDYFTCIHVESLFVFDKKF